MLAKAPTPSFADKTELDENDNDECSSSESDSDDDGDTAFDQFVATVKAGLKKAKAHIKVIKIKDGDVLCCSHSSAGSGAKVVSTKPSDSEEESKADSSKCAIQGYRAVSSQDPHLASYMTGNVWDDPFCLRGFISDRDSSSEPDSD